MQEGIRRNNKAKQPKSQRLQRADDRPRVTMYRGGRRGGACTGAMRPEGSRAGVEKKSDGGDRGVVEKEREKGKNLRVGSANVGSMSGRGGEVVDMLRRKKLDFCALQETRWKGSGAQVMGGYKFFWQGGKGGAGGVCTGSIQNK